MILANRLFERKEPDRSAKTIYIFCDGEKTEYEYFRFFQEKDSRLKVNIYKLSNGEDNSPLGLLKIAQSCFDSENQYPDYDFIQGDEIWFVMDIDHDKLNSREPQIKSVIEECNKRDGWHYAISNPCFEVWKYYHGHTKMPDASKFNTCAPWKTLLNTAFKGGFNNKLHPVFIENAIVHARAIHKEENAFPLLGCTGVYKLGESIWNLMKHKIQKVIKDNGLITNH